MPSEPAPPDPCAPDAPDAHTSAELARLLARTRQASGLTQRELANRIGTSASSISRLEDETYNGHSMASLRRLANGLGKALVVRLVDPPETTGAPPKPRRSLGGSEGIR